MRVRARTVPYHPGRVPSNRASPRPLPSDASLTFPRPSFLDHRRVPPRRGRRGERLDRVVDRHRERRRGGRVRGAEADRRRGAGAAREIAKVRAGHGRVGAHRAGLRRAAARHRGLRGVDQEDRVRPEPPRGSAGGRREARHGGRRGGRELVVCRARALIHSSSRCKTKNKLFHLTRLFPRRSASVVRRRAPLARLPPPSVPWRPPPRPAARCTRAAPRTRWFSKTHSARWPTRARPLYRPPRRWRRLRLRRFPFASATRARLSPTRTSRRFVWRTSLRRLFLSVLANLSWSSPRARAGASS
mmetsp:Transcript_3011/g.12005  ORF Transcript_3011/g.12005 Transcript_3011/m.12005 type:complete len:302 (-) Transcript_3011:516-1421(-)